MKYSFIVGYSFVIELPLTKQLNDCQIHFLLFPKTINFRVSSQAQYLPHLYVGVQAYLPRYWFSLLELPDT